MVEHVVPTKPMKPLPMLLHSARTAALAAAATAAIDAGSIAAGTPATSPIAAPASVATADSPSRHHIVDDDLRRASSAPALHH